MIDFDDPEYWRNEARAAARHAELCTVFPNNYAEGDARNPDYWRTEEAIAKRVADECERRLTPHT